MLKISQPIIVEGKYDKIALENVVDALIITTDGFGIFKNEEKRQLIKKFAQRDGIIILTDSDSAGSIIRGHIKSIVGNAPIINVYVPYLKGKEKRKPHHSKEGVLGVEGMSVEILKEAFKKSGITESSIDFPQKEITKVHLFEIGLSGGKGSSVKRKEFLKYLELPENLSPNAMLDILNNLFSLKQFRMAVEKCQALQEKS